MEFSKSFVITIGTIAAITVFSILFVIALQPKKEIPFQPDPPKGDDTGDIPERNDLMKSKKKN